MILASDLQRTRVAKTAQIQEVHILGKICIVQFPFTEASTSFQKKSQSNYPENYTEVSIPIPPIKD